MVIKNIDEIIQTDVNALRIVHTRATSGWEQWYLLKSDEHRDSPEADTDLEDKHLQQAIERDAGILSFGDLHDAMQGKGDQRGSKAKIRKELLTRSYWDSLTDYMVESYAHVADRYIMQARGNHELSVLNKNEVDLVGRFAAIMNTAHNGIVHPSGYTGWIRFSFNMNQGGGNRSQFTLYFSHGASGGQITKGLPGMMQKNHYIGDYDFQISGHTHNSFYVDMVKEQLSRTGKIENKKTNLLMLPSYKDGVKGGMGWESVKSIGGKPKGAWWIRFYYESKKIKYQITRAD